MIKFLDKSGLTYFYNKIKALITNIENSKAPIYHASTSSIYGLGTSSGYGHLKLSDTASNVYDAFSGHAATPKCVYDNFNQLNELLGGKKILTGESSYSYSTETTTKTIYFGYTFKSPPIVLFSNPFSSKPLMIFSNGVTTSSFKVGTNGFSSSGTTKFFWMAIGDAS